MSTESLPTVRGVRPRRIHPFWLAAKPLWAGLAIVVMWLAVLFVGIFGGDFVSSSNGGNSTTIPVVVFLLPFVLPASISAARHGFAESTPADALQTELEEQTHARERLEEEVAELRARLT